MPSSPTTDAEGVLRVRLMANGEQLPERVQLIRLTVHRAANTIPWARLEFADGDMATQKFEVSDGSLLAPGTELAIHLGYDTKDKLVYRGVVMRFGLQISGDNDSRLVIECRDKAARMAVDRRNSVHVDSSDSDLIKALLRDHGLDADVQDTGVVHAALVQHHCSDWDFMVSRAEANGRLVIARNGKVHVQQPDTGRAAVLSLNYGTSLMSFQADIDARTQLSSVQATAWDPKQQAAAQASAGIDDRVPQGDLRAGALAAVVHEQAFHLRTDAPQPADALDAWATAQQIKAALARVRGRMRFQGHARPQVGDMIELKGVGQRFNGTVFVGALTHEVADGNWTTEVEFGLAPQWFTERADLLAPRAGGLVPGVRGLHIGVVKQLHDDPAGEHRVQVLLPVMGADIKPVWARLSGFHASKAFGAFFLPEIGDEVMLGFINDDPAHPVVLGSVYSSARTPPYALAAENDTKAIVTRCKSRIEFNEKDKVITLSTPGGNQVVISDLDKSILLSDQNGNTAKLSPEGIRLDSPKDIVLQAKGRISLDAVGPISLKSQADASTSALNVSCDAQVSFSAKGTASAELSATGQTTVKGAMVMIN